MLTNIKLWLKWLKSILEWVSDMSLKHLNNIDLYTLFIFSKALLSRVHFNIPVHTQLLQLDWSFEGIDYIDVNR